MKMDFAVGMNRNERMDEIGEHARVAEESGFKFVTYVDQPFMSRDVFASMTIAALNTHRIHIGQGVLDMTTHHPLAVAGGTASIDEVSGGRTIVGMGAGGAFGEKMRPRSVRELRDAVEFIRRFTSGEEVEAGGQKLKCEFHRRQLPVYLAATGPRTLEMAGEVADGIMFSSAFGAHPEMLEVEAGTDRERRTESRQGSIEDRRMGAGHDLRGRFRGRGAAGGGGLCDEQRSQHHESATSREPRAGEDHPADGEGGAGA